MAEDKAILKSFKKSTTRLSTSILNYFAAFTETRFNVELQRKLIDRLKDELNIERVPASTFNPANYLKKHFDSLQSIARDTRSQDEYISSVKQYFKENIDDIVLYDLFISIQKYARYNTIGTIYLFFHELNRQPAITPMYRLLLPNPT